MALEAVQPGQTPLGGQPIQAVPAAPANAQQARTPDELEQLSHSTTNLSLPDAITVATQAAPKLDPTTVVAVAQSGGDVQQKAQVVDHIKRTNSMIDAATEVGLAHPDNGGIDGALSWLGHNVVKAVGDAAHFVGQSPIGKGLSDLGNVANLPLRDVQHEWRYLHDVEARHGLSAAVSEGLVISAGVLGGGVLGGPDGAILGGEVAAHILGGVKYHDSWTRTADGSTYTDPNTGNVVSFGRDLASMFTHESPGYVGRGKQKRAAQQSAPFGFLSGVLDGVGDLMTDPLALAGKLKSAASSVEGGSGVIGKHWGGLGITDASTIDRAYDTNPSFRRVVGQLKNMDSAQILNAFPKMIPIAKYLEGAKTDEQVLDVLKAPVLTANLMTDHLPTQSFARMSLQGLRDAAANYEGPLSNNFVMGPARWARRFSKVTGSAFDENSKTLSGKVIDPMSDQHAEDIFRFVNYTQNRTVASMTAAQWLEAAPAQRIIMLRNIIMNNIAHAAHFAPVTDENGALDYAELQDPQTQAAMKLQLDQWTGGGDPGLTGTYGLHGDGSTSTMIRDNETGRSWSAAVLENQTGKIALPSFTNIKRMGGQLRQLRQSNMFGKALDDVGYFSGKLDDFAYNAITQPFFKPLVLLSGSYAEHIAAAEVIPNTLRNGLLRTVQSYAYNFNKRLGYENLKPGEEKAILGSILQGMGDDGEGLAAMSPTERALRLEAETLLQLKTEGHKMTSAVSSADNWGKEISDQARIKDTLHNLVSHETPHKRTDDFGAFTSNQKIEGYTSGKDPTGFHTAWRDELREINNSPAASMAAKALWASKGRLDDEEAVKDAGRVAASQLRKMTPEQLDLFQRSKLFNRDWYEPEERPIPEGREPIDDWGLEIARHVRSRLGTEMNEPLLEHLIHQSTPTVKRLQEIVPQDEMPTKVRARIAAPSARGGMAALADLGFRRAINPFVDFVSRQPIFRIEFQNQWRQLRPLVQNGVYDIDEASNIALNRATMNVMPFVHNLHDRSQISETLRNWVPFYFAQEQAYRRMGRLLAQDPGAFRRYQMMISAVGHMNGTAVDGTNGQKYYLIPGGNFLAEGSTQILQHLKMPVVNVDAGQLQTSLSSASVIFPLSSGYRPDASPVAALSARALYAMWPELGPNLSKLVNTQNLTDPIWQQAVPNTLAQRLLRATVLRDGDRAFVTAQNQAIQLAAYEQTEATYKWILGGKKGPQPRIFPMDAGAGFSTGMGPAQTMEQQRFLNKIKNQTTIMFLTSAMASFFAPTSITPKVQDFGFTKEVNDSISKYGSVSKGVQEFLLAHPLATPYTVFQSVSKSGTSLQATAPAEDWIHQNANFIQTHPNAAFAMMPDFSGKYSYAIYNEQLAQGDRVKRSPSEFLNAMYVAAGNAAYYPELANYEKYAQSGDKNTREQAYNQFNSWVNTFSATHPVWAQEGPLNKVAKQDNSRQAILQIGKMIATNQVPNNPIAHQVVELYHGYRQFNDAWVAAGQAHDWSKAQKAVKDGYFNYLQTVSQRNPHLSQTVSMIFEGALGETNGNTAS